MKKATLTFNIYPSGKKGLFEIALLDADGYAVELDWYAISNDSDFLELRAREFAKDLGFKVVIQKDGK